MLTNQHKLKIIRKNVFHWKDENNSDKHPYLIDILNKENPIPEFMNSSIPKYGYDQFI